MEFFMPPPLSVTIELEILLIELFLPKLVTEFKFN
jgi:hypothetical protein